MGLVSQVRQSSVFFVLCLLMDGIWIAPVNRFPKAAHSFTLIDTSNMWTTGAGI